MMNASFENALHFQTSLALFTVRESPPVEARRSKLAALLIALRLATTKKNFLNSPENNKKRFANSLN